MIANQRFYQLGSARGISLSQFRRGALIPDRAAADNTATRL
jgi:hypothetical protein